MASAGLSRIARKLNEAEGYLMLEMPEHALRILDSRDDWATMRFEAGVLRGDALRMTGRFREALQALEEAARIRPNDESVAVMLGWCYKRTNQLAQAIDALLPALRAHPSSSILHYNLACYWSLVGDVPKAVAYLSTAIRLDARFRAAVESEADFDGIRAEPAFVRLMDSPTRGI
ncbi:MAG: tetratricopeptide repeat protein [Isosphaeraceae bacterium]|nr:tetratricopeptide repeat protein [Isosphaeraceae bacterium]